MTPSTTERLAVRLREALGAEIIPDGTTIRRIHAGRHQRAEGAWSWSTFSPGRYEVGSQWPVSVVLRCRHWEIDRSQEPDFYSIHIDPCRECRTRE